MKKNRIIIKECGEYCENGGLLWELARAGVPEGTIITDFKYNENSGACYFRSKHGDCVAYIGETCEFI